MPLRLHISSPNSSNKTAEAAKVEKFVLDCKKTRQLSKQPPLQLCPIRSIGAAQCISSPTTQCFFTSQTWSLTIRTRSAGKYWEMRCQFTVHETWFGRSIRSSVRICFLVGNFSNVQSSSSLLIAANCIGGIGRVFTVLKGAVKLWNGHPCWQRLNTFAAYRNSTISEWICLQVVKSAMLIREKRGRPRSQFFSARKGGVPGVLIRSRSLLRTWWMRLRE